MYYRAPSVAEPEQHYHLLAYLYTCAVLRQASLLFSVWSAKGWGRDAFTAMLRPGPDSYAPPTLAQNELRSPLYLERMGSVSGVSRSHIATILAQAHGAWLLHLGPIERIAVLECMARMYSWLGFRRKEAYLLREILSCILDLLVCGREEDDYSRKTPVSGGLGITGLALEGHQPKGRGSVGVRQNESTEGNESILRLVKHVCVAFGVNLDAVQLVESDTSGVESHSGPGSPEGDDDVNAIREPYGWPELQVGVVREAVAIAEALPGLIVYV
jgi:hypothetical protein